MKLIALILLIAAAFIAVYLAGPKVQYEPLESPEISPWNISLDSLEAYVNAKDLNIPDLKPDNQSRIIWADSIRKTRYSVVYLHGFSASPMESNPTHMDFARTFGFNLYLPLLAGHGRNDRDSFKDLQPNDLIRSAKEAIAIGQLLGDDVIVMSCSTGSTLSIFLAGANQDLIDVQMMYSPNISLNDPTARLITGPWGVQVLKVVTGEYWNPDEQYNPEDEGSRYWTRTYRTEGLLALQALLDGTMQQKVFEKVANPYFVGYYYKNDEEKDRTISVEAILDFDQKTSTTPELKRMVAFPNVGEHVIANPLKSKDVPAVLDATVAYAREVLRLEPIQ